MTKGKVIYKALHTNIELWHLKPLSTIVQIYYSYQFYWWGKPNDREKPNDMPEVTNYIV